MKKPNLQRLAQRSKIYLRKASPTILSGLGAAGVIVTSVLAVRATPKALRKIRADSKVNHDGDPEAYSKLEAVRSAWVCYIPTAISGTASFYICFMIQILRLRLPLIVIVMTMESIFGTDSEMSRDTGIV